MAFAWPFAAHSQASALQVKLFPKTILVWNHYMGFRTTPIYMTMRRRNVLRFLYPVKGGDFGPAISNDTQLSCLRSQIWDITKTHTLGNGSAILSCWGSNKCRHHRPCVIPLLFYNEKPLRCGQIPPPCEVQFALAKSPSSYIMFLVIHQPNGHQNQQSETKHQKCKKKKKLFWSKSTTSTRINHLNFANTSDLRFKARWLRSDLWSSPVRRPRSRRTAARSSPGSSRPSNNEFLGHKKCYDFVNYLSTIGYFVPIVFLDHLFVVCTFLGGLQELNKHFERVITVEELGWFKQNTMNPFEKHWSHKPLTLTRNDIFEQSICNIFYNTYYSI